MESSKSVCDESMWFLTSFKVKVICRTQNTIRQLDQWRDLFNTQLFSQIYRNVADRLRHNYKNLSTGWEEFLPQRPRSVHRVWGIFSLRKIEILPLFQHEIMPKRLNQNLLLIDDELWEILVGTSLIRMAGAMYVTFI